MVAAGIGDYTALLFFSGQGGDFVISSPDFKRPNRLEILRLEIKQPVIFRLSIRYKLGAYGDPGYPALRQFNIV
jgi:hypothetical protein